MKRFLIAIASVCICATSVAKGISRPTVIVIIPERHLSAPRVPDPAVETAIIRALIDAGYKVIDPARFRELRNYEAVDRILTKGANWKADVMRIGRKFGAEVLVTGEAFTQVASRRAVTTDLGTVNIIQCRGRAELRAYRTGTAEYLFVDSDQRTGPEDPTEELSSKAALEELGVALAPKLIAKLNALGGQGGSVVQVQFRSVERASDVTTLAKALAGVPGVVRVSDPEFEGRTVTVEVTLRGLSAANFAAKVEGLSSLKRYKLQSQSISKDSVIFNVRSRP